MQEKKNNMKLIDKDRIVTEIERRRRDWRYGSSIEAKFKREECDDILSFLDTIETKDVNLEKETTHYLLYEHLSPLNEIMHKADIKAEMQYHKDIENAFKAGFELGLKSKGE